MAAPLHPSSAKQQKRIDTGSKAVTGCIYSNPTILYGDTGQSDVPRRYMCDCLRLRVLFLFPHQTSIGMFLRVRTTSGSSRKSCCRVFKPTLLCSSVDTLLPC